MISLMMVVAATTTSFAKSNNTDVANAVKSVAEQVKQAPSGTVYGVVENTKHHIIVALLLSESTPLRRRMAASALWEYRQSWYHQRMAFIKSRHPLVILRRMPERGRW